MKGHSTTAKWFIPAWLRTRLSIYTRYQCSWVFALYPMICPIRDVFTLTLACSQSCLWGISTSNGSKLIQVWIFGASLWTISPHCVYIAFLPSTPCTFCPTSVIAVWKLCSWFNTIIRSWPMPILCFRIYISLGRNNSIHLVKSRTSKIHANKELSIGNIKPASTIPFTIEPSCFIVSVEIWVLLDNFKCLQISISESI